MDVLHAPEAKPRQRVVYPLRHCPECMEQFRPQDQRQLFCSPAHRAAWNNRATVRGRVLMPYVLAARVTRDGTRGNREAGKHAAQVRHRLIQGYIEEDRAAGRMDWASYVALRQKHGFDPQ